MRRSWPARAWAWSSAEGCENLNPDGCADAAAATAQQQARKMADDVRIAKTTQLS